MLRTTLLVAVVTSIAALTLTISPSASTPRESSTPHARVATHMGKTAQAWQRIAFLRLKARDWYHARLGERTRELIKLQRRFHAAPTRPPHYQEWLCIHGGEGAWNSNTGNGYYGGLQFAQSTWDRNGGQKYASRADLADPLEQMWVAENAWAESGGSFSQWPATSRACGLH